MVDRTAVEVFGEFREVFLLAPPSYVVSAVWGVQGSGEITETQQRIHDRVRPAVQESMEPLLTEGLEPAQQFAIDFMLRGLIITKIIYMIEIARRQIEVDGTPEKGTEESSLASLEPLGTA
jgi:hypothetical protein